MQLQLLHSFCILMCNYIERQKFKTHIIIHYYLEFFISTSDRVTRRINIFFSTQAINFYIISREDVNQFVENVGVIIQRAFNHNYR